MLLVGITDTEVHLTVCFAVMFTTNCSIDVYACDFKTDSQEKIIGLHSYPGLLHTRKRFQSNIHIVTYSQSVVGGVLLNCSN